MTEPAISGADEPLLAGVTVVDFTRVLAGPYGTRMLADLGARVIKIERPGEGDEIRYTIFQLDPERTDQSSYFTRLNAGKQSIAIDLAHPQARELALDLVRGADVVVENFSPGVMARYGLDEAATRRKCGGNGATGITIFTSLNLARGLFLISRCDVTGERGLHIDRAVCLESEHNRCANAN